jgi:hypothetical protein
MDLPRKGNGKKQQLPGLYVDAEEYALLMELESLGYDVPEIRRMALKAYKPKLMEILNAQKAKPAKAG